MIPNAIRKWLRRSTFDQQVAVFGRVMAWRNERGSWCFGEMSPLQLRAFLESEEAKKILGRQSIASRLADLQKKFDEMIRMCPTPAVFEEWQHGKPFPPPSIQDHQRRANTRVEPCYPWDDPGNPTPSYGMLIQHKFKRFSMEDCAHDSLVPAYYCNARRQGYEEHLESIADRLQHSGFRPYMSCPVVSREAECYDPPVADDAPAAEVTADEPAQPAEAEQIEARHEMRMLPEDEASLKAEIPQRLRRIRYAIISRIRSRTDISDEQKALNIAKMQEEWRQKQN